MIEGESMHTPPREAWRGRNIWAPQRLISGNRVTQLLVPAGPLEVKFTGEEFFACNNFGIWPAYRGGTSPRAHGLQLRLPSGFISGFAPRESKWESRGPEDSVAAVIASFENQLTFNKSSDERTGLRRPQLGAVHAVLGYWTTGRLEPATVVMPTGTGKTETMLALLVAAAIPRLLVLVPSDALRTQVAAKFERLGVLQELGIVGPDAKRPNVGTLEHGFESLAEAIRFADSSNVIVTTPQILTGASSEVRDAILSRCSHLFVDEAHHVAAPTWASIRTSFAEKPVVQFTATPFREDGQSLSGRNIYSFPLREAQADGYYSNIDYIPVTDLFDTDRALAEKAVEVLRRDLASGFEHVLMARTNSQPRTTQLLKYYEDIAPDLNPVVLHSGLSAVAKSTAQREIADRSARIIICVNMLGEGYDLPTLKVAAVHDPQKSLGVTLQFIGRFARTGVTNRLGRATMLVAKTGFDTDTRLRELYAEDADWNLILRDLTETAVEEQAALGEFEAGFTSLPEEVTLRNLLPKMSATVFRTPTDDWSPHNLTQFFGEANLLTRPIGLNQTAGVAWCVVRHQEMVRWGNLRTIEQVTYELFVLYFDKEHQLLYINSSENSGVFQELAESIAGEPVTRFTGPSVYRVLAGIERLVPTNVGVLDVQSQFRRFSMHVGSDVREGFPTSEAQTKTQTHISANGFVGGERTDMSASLKGRIWSHSTASNLKKWVDWCDRVGAKLTDGTIDLDEVIANFIYPQDILERPDAVLLALEWPWEIYLRTTERLTLTADNKSFFILDVQLRVDDFRATGPFRFSVVTSDWELSYSADFQLGALTFSPLREEVRISDGKTEAALSAWLNAHGLMFFLDGDATIEPNGKLLRPNRQVGAYSRAALRQVDWSGIDLSIGTGLRNAHDLRRDWFHRPRDGNHRYDPRSYLPVLGGLAPCSGGPSSHFRPRAARSRLGRARPR
jgi:superfamily II DNA or RNA helicase